MTGTKESIDQQHATLQQQVRGLHDKLVACDPDEDRYNTEYERLVQATRELLSFEQRMPDLLAEPERASSERVVLWSWRTQAVVAAVLVALVFILDRTWWWLVLLVPQFVGVLSGSFQKIGAKEHRTRRHTAIALHVVVVLTVLLFFQILPMWLLAVILPGWLGVAIASSEDPTNKAPQGRQL
ncbi:hypothetical protein ACIOUE_37925 [Streptomyces xanthochromogenes]|uniref:hypothetical protein n=1 Tax=Streptomyces xanthochromogenes TaxID=67384 RepID=UPI0037F1992A